MRTLCLAILTLTAVSTSATAQIFYQPVQYQFGEQTKFYYGGRDGRLFEFARRAARGDTNRLGLTSDEPERVYSDRLGFQNARYFGYTASDASNEAHANAPTYFRKRDLLNAAIPTSDGTWIVPAMAQPVCIDQNPPTTQPVVQMSRPAPVLIIPRGQLIPVPKSNLIKVMNHVSAR